MFSMLSVQGVSQESWLAWQEGGSCRPCVCSGGLDWMTHRTTPNILWFCDLHLHNAVPRPRCRHARRRADSAHGQCTATQTLAPRLRGAAGPHRGDCQRCCSHRRGAAAPRHEERLGMGIWCPEAFPKRPVGTHPSPFQPGAALSRGGEAPAARCARAGRHTPTAARHGRERGCPRLREPRLSPEVEELVFAFRTPAS